jgi:hypothetical protein
MMLKQEVATRTLYNENPLTAGHPVKGTQVTILGVENGGPYLVGHSHVEWDETAKKNIAYTGYDHYEKRPYSMEEATKIVEGKIKKLIADGYVFEVTRDIHHFIETGQWLHEVHNHSRAWRNPASRIRIVVFVKNLLMNRRNILPPAIAAAKYGDKRNIGCDHSGCNRPSELFERAPSIAPEQWQEARQQD